MRAAKHLFSLLQTIVASMGYTWPDKAGIEPPKDKKFGDLAVNVALVLAKEAGKPPRQLAEAVAEALRGNAEIIAAVDVAGPGFLNVTFSPAFWQSYIPLVEQAGPQYGGAPASNPADPGQEPARPKAHVEFVSANPTGPLHIGHGRGAAIGDSVARIMRFAGYDVTTEYYINDAGKQMRTLGLSVYRRVRECTEGDIGPFPDDYYKGDYIIDIARDLLRERPDLPQLPEEQAVDLCYEYGMAVIFDGIKQDLRDFRVSHDVWFSEKSLVRDGSVEKTLCRLREAGHAYEKDGAFWFNASAMGDDKDRVLRKSDGNLTYFASDIAYHANKYRRGFTSLIDVWGADHHGYIPRMRAAVEALGEPEDSFDVILVQLVNLLRDGKQVAMSTRAGEFETLADVVKEVGTDAARFIFLSRKSDSKLDFDLELVKQRTMDNPVYYVQYAHARIQAVLRRAAERGIARTAGDLSLLTRPEELELLRLFDRFPQVVADAARNHAPHYISYFLMDIAGVLHRYYSAHSILGADGEALIAARLRLVEAAGVIVKNGLELLGVTAPESM